MLVLPLPPPLGNEPDGMRRTDGASGVAPGVGE